MGKDNKKQAEGRHQDIVATLQRVTGGNPDWKMNGETGTMVFKPAGGKVSTPWVRIKPTVAPAPEDVRHCLFWRYVYFDYFDFIPRFCRDRCWKTMIRPRNVSELFDLEIVLRELGLLSKCGMDLRDYTHQAWLGVVYGNSLEEGRAYCAAAKTAIATAVSPQIDVTLVRGCTEMEIWQGPSDKWGEATKEELALEDALDSFFDFQTSKENTKGLWDPALIHDVKVEWLRHAVAIGDSSAEMAARAFFDNEEACRRIIARRISYNH